MVKCDWKKDSWPFLADFFPLILRAQSSTYWETIPALQITPAAMFFMHFKIRKPPASPFCIRFPFRKVSRPATETLSGILLQVPNPLRKDKQPVHGSLPQEIWKPVGNKPEIRLPGDLSWNFVAGIPEPFTTIIPVLAADTKERKKWEGEGEKRKRKCTGQ